MGLFKEKYMITINRNLDSNRNQRAFADRLNVVEEKGVVEKVLGLHDSAKAGGLVSTAYVVLDSRPFARQRCVGLTNEVARKIANLKEGYTVNISGQLQMRGYIAVQSIEVLNTGIEEVK
jgi:hypothetical protein